MILLQAGWKLSKSLVFDLNEVARGKNKYIEKLFARVSHIFNKTLLCRYPHPHEVTIDNDSKFNGHFTPLLNEFTIPPIHAYMKNIQSDSTVEHIHQLIYNMIVTKDLDRKVYDYIYYFGETKASVV